MINDLPTESSYESLNVKLRKGSVYVPVDFKKNSTGIVSITIKIESSAKDDNLTLRDVISSCFELHCRRNGTMAFRILADYTNAIGRSSQYHRNVK